LAILGASCPRPLSARSGADAYQAGDYAAAEEGFRDQAADSKKAGPSYNLGNALYRQERFDEAARAYQEALQKNSRLEDAWYNLGNAFFRQDRFKDAIRAYQGALALVPDDRDAQHNLELAKRALEKNPRKDRSGDPPQPPTPTPTPPPPGKKGDQGDEDKPGKNPDPTGKKSEQGEAGATSQPGNGASQQRQRRERQEQARRNLGMSDEQVQKTLDNRSREENRLQPYFSRNPRRDLRRRNDPMNMLPREQREMMRRFFGSGHLGKKMERDEPEKDW
jgi:tetratricopeptide (TPR) repeat protein